MALLNITKEAAEQIKEIADAEGINEVSIRIKVQGNGCAGIGFDVEFSNQASELDEQEIIEGINVIIDPLSAPYISGTTMNYISNGMEEGLRFSGGDIKTSCACGSSYVYEDKK